MLNIPKFLEYEVKFHKKYPHIYDTEFRLSPLYISDYLLWTQFITTALIPVLLLLYLNNKILMNIIRNNSPINDIQLSTKELRNKHFLRHRNKIDWSLLRKIA